MSFTHIQGITGGHGGSGATITLTFGSAISSGSTVCGGGQFASSTTLTSVTDDKSNTYNVETNITASGQTAFAFSLGNITNGPTTITITLGASSGFNSAVADEYSGALAASDPRDVHGGQTQNTPGTGADAYTSGNFTTTTNGDLLYGFTVTTNSATAISNFVAGTGFTIRSRDTPAGLGDALSEDRVQASAGSTAATFTDTTDTGTVVSITYLIAIKPAASVTYQPHAGICM